MPNAPRIRTSRAAAALAVSALTAACAAAPAPAATTFSIRGAGFGHGVGMSQYGAYGYAKHGTGYRQILAHYYTATEIGRTDTKTIRVLLRSGMRRISFSGAGRACGRAIRPDRGYLVTRKGSRLVLRSARGRSLATCDSPLRASGSVIRISRVGSYRGALEVRPTLLGGMNAINAVPLEYYVRGVVPNESPSGWPLEALKAQAVAARSYALATSVRGLGFDQFSDTRSQVYRGRSSEAASSNRAVRETAGEVVTYGGKTAVTYFFSTSGGQTENVEFGFPGGEPKPWLKSVSDPYDDASPYHRWGPYRMSRATLQRKLRGLVKGTLQSVRVVKRGRSPRVVLADVVGSGGTTRVRGSTLRTRLGLRDTWFYIRRLGSSDSDDGDTTTTTPTETTTVPAPPTQGSGGVPPTVTMGAGGQAPPP
jgi:stage II sporulation protein D